MAQVHKGSCLCGAVTLEVVGPLPAASACHCTQCRKHTGHFEAGIDVSRSRVRIAGQEAISWYQSSPKVRRGFCATCGSSLFFDLSEADWIGINLGAFDGPTGTHLALHIFVGDKGDYYEIADGLPQYETVPQA